MLFILFGRNINKIVSRVNEIKNSEKNDCVIAIIDWSDNNNETLLEGIENVIYISADNSISKASAINYVVSNFPINENICLIDENVILMPNAIRNMQYIINKKNAGIVGPIGNRFVNQQKIDISDEKDLSEYISEISISDNISAINDIFVWPEIVIIKKQLWNILGGFDDTFSDLYGSMKDFCIRTIMSDFEILICKNSCVLFSDNNVIESHNETDTITRLNNKFGEMYANRDFGLTDFAENLIDLIDEDNDVPINVLDVGCDCGMRLMSIKNKFNNANIFGCDINEKAIAFASHFANVSIVNIEDKNLDFGNIKFDYIVLGDILEHLRDPKSALENLKNLLKDDGKIISSIPNFMNIMVMENLLNGYFTYTDVGLLDRTHIHMFTYKEIINIFNDAGYNIIDIESLIINPNDEQEMLIDSLLKIGKDTERHMYVTFQYLIKANKKTS